jgi:hypothetical protein
MFLELKNLKPNISKKKQNLGKPFEINITV